MILHARLARIAHEKVIKTFDMRKRGRDGDQDLTMWMREVDTYVVHPRMLEIAYSLILSSVLDPLAGRTRLGYLAASQHANFSAQRKVRASHRD